MNFEVNPIDELEEFMQLTKTSKYYLAKIDAIKNTLESQKWADSLLDCIHTIQILPLQLDTTASASEWKRIVSEQKQLAIAEKKKKIQNYTSAL